MYLFFSRQEGVYVVKSIKKRRKGNEMRFFLKRQPVEKSDSSFENGNLPEIVFGLFNL